VPEIIISIANWFGHNISVYKDEILAIGTAIIALYTFILARISHRQLKDSRILQRAYLSVEPRGIHALKERSASVAHIGIRNSGNLPAYDVNWGITHQFSLDRDKEHFPAPLADGSVILPPRTEMIQGGGEITFPSEVLPEGPTYLYVWGVVTYRDGFKTGRTTKFCHRYNCINAERDVSGGSSIPSNVARHNRRGNEAT